MNSQIVRFYQVFKNHQFTEAEVEIMVEGFRAIIKDENQENATKKDISELQEEIRKDVEELKREIAQVQLAMTQTFHQSEEKQSDRFRYVYEKMADNHQATITWLVGVSIATGSLIIAAIKLL